MLLGATSPVSYSLAYSTVRRAYCYDDDGDEVVKLQPVSAFHSKAFCKVCHS